MRLQEAPGNIEQKEFNVMSIIKWREAYNTGVDQFDEEHHKIVELINIMFETIRDKSDTQITLKVIEELISYTEYHFTNEEDAMKASAYRHTDAHIAAHERLIKRVQQFQVNISENFPEGTSGLYRFLREWLVEHIQAVDKQYGPHLKDSGETG
jgi:hemerythrin